MSDDLAEVEQLAGALLRSLSPASRRSILRSMARSIQASQRARVASQRNPDGSGFAPRKPRREPQRVAYAVRFLYPKGASEPREVFMKSWVRRGDWLTGFDAQAGDVRTFRWDRVEKWLPVEAEDRNKNAGKLRRNGHIRRKAMFRKLASSREMKAGATDQEAWVGFSGMASVVASIHQRGLADRPRPRARAIRYAQRELLGVTAAERTELLDVLLAHVGDAVP